MQQIIKTITSEVTEVMHQIDPDEVEQFAHQLAKSNRIFIAGTGRSGLAGKMFAMRLMHIGYQSYVVGETITPSIGEDDLLIIVSGSGGTKTLVHYVNKAKQTGARISLMTTNRQSAIGQLSDDLVEIPATTKQTKEQRKTIQPMGSQFDQSLHLLLDSIIVFLIDHYADNDQQTFTNKHANLE